MTKTHTERLEELRTGTAQEKARGLAAALPRIGAENDPLCLALDAALARATETGDGRILDRALDEIGEVNISVGQFGLTPLMQMLLSKGRSLDRLEMFLAHGARVNMRAEDGSAPLYAIVDYRGGEDPDLMSITRNLVAAGADIEARDSYGWTPLLRACVEGNLAELRALLSAGADPNAVCEANRDPALVLAAGDPDKVKALLDNSARPDRAMLDMIRQRMETATSPEQLRKLRASMTLLIQALPH